MLELLSLTHRVCLYVCVLQRVTVKEPAKATVLQMKNTLTDVRNAAGIPVSARHSDII